ncbi:chromosomal replication initiator protein DnaA [Tianweitania sp. BSSL-BM11]|uniref:Chromosomal replication initiator protein DnaA n=2 Tax=Tianweitania aestuarii TaxID=2814886 RepID=A0ABS5RQH3_9HYPH|nr:chromosomal replication initiator protein DnaA [Tianweitania aestuarii]
MHSGFAAKSEFGLPIQTNSNEDQMTAGDAAGERVFERVKVQLRARLGNDVYSSWFGRMKLAEASKGIVRLSVPTAFLRSWINNHYIRQIEELWQAEEPSTLKVEVIVRSATRNTAPVQSEAAVQRNRAAKPTAGVAAAPSIKPMLSVVGAPAPRPASGETEARGSSIGSPLDQRYTFESFVEGPSNRVAFAAAKAVAETAPNAVRFNPLYIHSSVGLGKTHLLQAIADEAIRNRPGSRVVYLTAEYFMWRFASAIRDNSALALKEHLRDIDLLIIDDMQFLQGKSIQNEFCHLLNMLLDSAKQVVVAADRPATELESLEPRVRSRLSGGVSLEMAAPDFSMRLSMLRHRLALAQAEDATITISEEILNHIAHAIPGSGREIEGAFNQVLFRRSFEPQLDVDRIDEMLAHIFRSGEPKRVRIEDIQRVVARHYNVSKTELLSNRRTRTIVKPRQVAMYLSKVLTPRSLPEIGRRFGGRDHTTVLHAVRKIEDLTGSDAKLAQEIEFLRRLINEAQ